LDSRYYQGNEPQDISDDRTAPELRYRDWGQAPGKDDVMIHNRGLWAQFSGSEFFEEDLYNCQLNGYDKDCPHQGILTELTLWKQQRNFHDT
jgi:hypothetical protein